MLSPFRKSKNEKRKEEEFKKKQRMITIPPGFYDTTSFDTGIQDLMNKYMAQINYANLNSISTWNTVTSTSPPMASTSSTKFNPRDIVRITADHCSHGLPIGYIVRIEDIRFIPTRLGPTYRLTGHSSYITDDDAEFADKADERAATPAPKPKKFELKELDPLVVAKEVKAEIEAVLKQHKHSTKLFKEWGLEDVIEYGKGMTFLFHGPPGTGKTWAATCIAKVLGKKLLTIGAAEIQTSEPGGANRNIQNAFKAATEQDQVLFIDECDSLISSREGLGMILGAEVNTLLTEIEKYEGVVILATNRIGQLDAALERRIALIIEFPEPTFEQRKDIWEKMLPKKMPLDEKVTPEKLAHYQLTGGQIKNVLLQAARLAVASESAKVEAAHFEQAVERVLKSKSLMGKSNWIQVRDDYTKVRT